MGKLTINTKHLSTDFSYKDASYLLRGSAKADFKTGEMVDFNASVYKVQNDEEMPCGNVSTSYDPSNGLRFNFLDMDFMDLIMVAPIIQSCTKELQAQEESQDTEEPAK